MPFLKLPPNKTDLSKPSGATRRKEPPSRLLKRQNVLRLPCPGTSCTHAATIHGARTGGPPRGPSAWSAGRRLVRPRSTGTGSTSSTARSTTARGCCPVGLSVRRRTTGGQRTVIAVSFRHLHLSRFCYGSTVYPLAGRVYADKVIHG